jgi:hypothetical protein
MTDDVPVPPRLASRPRDRRGYVVPYAQFVDRDGVPQFQVMDDVQVQNCLTRRCCGLCGQPMGKHIYFIGGDLCVRNGFFHDPPMHRECAEYALRACPHLARVKGRYGPIPEIEGGVVVVGAVSTIKVETFALMHGSAFTWSRDRTGMVLIKAALPWLDVSWWRNGELVEAPP